MDALMVGNGGALPMQSRAIYGVPHIYKLQDMEFNGELLLVGQSVSINLQHFTGLHLWDPCPAGNTPAGPCQGFTCTSPHV